MPHGDVTEYLMSHYERQRDEEHLDPDAEPVYQRWLYRKMRRERD